MSLEMAPQILELASGFFYQQEEDSVPTVGFGVGGSIREYADETLTEGMLSQAVLLDAPRSSEWDDFRAKFLPGKKCACCGWPGPKGKDKEGKGGVLELHHWDEPFHVNPSRECDPSNVIVLCRRPLFSCHWIIGHCRRSWSCWNPDVLGSIKLLQQFMNSLYASAKY